VGNGKRLLVESETLPPRPVARFQALDSFGQLAEIHRKTRQNNWWAACASLSSFFGIAVGVYHVELANFEYHHPEATLSYFGTGFVRFCIAALAFLTVASLAVYYDGRAYLLQIKGAYIPKGASFFMRLRRVGLLDACIWDMVCACLVSLFLSLFSLSLRLCEYACTYITRMHLHISHEYVSFVYVYHIFHTCMYIIRIYMCIIYIYIYLSHICIRMCMHISAYIYLYNICMYILFSIYNDLYAHMYVPKAYT